MIPAPDNVTGRDTVRMTKYRLCAECWGELYYDPNVHGYLCRTKGCTCNSSISRRTVEIREAQNEADLLKAQRAMAQVLGLPGRVTPNQTAIMKELGF